MGVDEEGDAQGKEEGESDEYGDALGEGEGGVDAEAVGGEGLGG